VYDIKTQKLDFWDKRVTEYIPPTDGRFSSILVPTTDTTRYSWLLNQVIKLKKPVLFCGDSGTAKTVTVFSAFQQLDPETYIYLNINFSSRTSSLDFQNIVHENIDRKSGKIFGPKTLGKKLILYIDDLNMPTIDKYGT
jgi:dynein heavy chain